jgi:hypothetical protein
MVAKNQDSNYYTIEVNRDIPLSEQLHKANAQLCLELRVEEKVFLEDIQCKNGYKVLRYRFWKDEPVKR